MSQTSSILQPQYYSLPGPENKRYELPIPVYSELSDSIHLSGTTPAPGIGIVVDSNGQPGQIVTTQLWNNPAIIFKRFVPLHQQTMESPAAVTMENVKPTLKGLVVDPPGIPPGYPGSTSRKSDFTVKDTPYILVTKGKCGSSRSVMFDNSDELELVVPAKKVGDITKCGLEVVVPLYPHGNPMSHYAVSRDGTPGYIVPVQPTCCHNCSDAKLASDMNSHFGEYLYFVPLGSEPPMTCGRFWYLAE